MIKMLKIINNVGKPIEMVGNCTKKCRKSDKKYWKFC